MPPTTTSVEIFGAVYHVRGDDESGRVQGLADLVDRKMREIAQHITSGDTTRIAILAALNLADELFRLQQAQEEERVEIREKMAALTEELTRALEG
ncbi:MAG TPA: cell division protein ZapA [Thermoanaerobaculia bacterium]|nr:cell division protein ZapA [Thermoanaerobaculia bacterium]